jgi:predicted nucleotidyltransferase
MIDLKREYLEEIKNILTRQVPDCEARLFGSRVKGKARAYSDIDIILVSDAKLDWRVIERLKDAFSASRLPFMVDVLDWQTLSEEFKKALGADFVVLRRPG